MPTVLLHSSRQIPGTFLVLISYICVSISRHFELGTNYVTSSSITSINIFTLGFQRYLEVQSPAEVDLNSSLVASLSLNTFLLCFIVCGRISACVEQYCAGRTPRLLAKLGFPKVEHRNEDFYQLIREKRQPVHDVLVTNPPYSGDHKKLCLEYCRRSGKPWFLLIPNYVATKDYYRLATLGSAAGLGGEPFYLVPETKYAFDHPEGTGHTDSPFSGVWYVHCGIHTQTVFEGIRALKRARISVVRSLEDLGRVGAVKTQRRLNPRQRKAISKKRSAAAAEMA